MYRSIIRIPPRLRHASAFLRYQMRFLALVSDPSMVNDSRAPNSFAKQSAVVFPEAITVSEHDALVTQIEPLLKRYACSFRVSLLLCTIDSSRPSLTEYITQLYIKDDGTKKVTGIR